MLRSDPYATLTPTTLVNKAWLKLAPSPHVANTTPVHFRRIAARAMRQVLVDAARRRHADIRGGNMPHVSFDESLAVVAVPQDMAALLALDRALADLEQIAPRHAQLLEARFFGGLSWTECGRGSIEAVGKKSSGCHVQRPKYWPLGRALLALKRYSEAEKQLTSSEQIMKNMPHPPPEMTKVRHALAALYRATNKPVKAKLYETEIASTTASLHLPRK